MNKFGDLLIEVAHGVTFVKSAKDDRHSKFRLLFSGLLAIFLTFGVWCSSMADTQRLLCISIIFLGCTYLTLRRNVFIDTNRGELIVRNTVLGTVQVGSKTVSFLHLESILAYVVSEEDGRFWHKLVLVDKFKKEILLNSWQTSSGDDDEEVVEFGETLAQLLGIEFGGYLDRPVWKW